MSSIQKAIHAKIGKQKSSWTDRLDKNKYSPDKIARWKSKELKAEKDFKSLKSDSRSSLPATSPAGRAYWNEKNKKS